MKKFLKQNWPWLALLTYFIIPLDFVPDLLAPIIGPIAYADDILIVFVYITFKFLSDRKLKDKKVDQKILEGELIAKENSAKS